MAAPKLLLHPASPETVAVPEDRLAQELQAIGLIGGPVPLGKGVFYPVGEQFLQLVTFLGCSPAIELDPPRDPQELVEASAAGRFCHVFITSRGQLQFRGDNQTRTPRCPRCRSPEPHWKARLQTWQEGKHVPEWNCQACGYSGRLSDLVFRKSAGFGRTFLEIRGIYPSEAVPGPDLLDTLAALTGSPWTAIYLRE
jgi:Zn ribbon nucleic-acid-binding protein